MSSLSPNPPSLGDPNLQAIREFSRLESLPIDILTHIFELIYRERKPITLGRRSVDDPSDRLTHPVTISHHPDTTLLRVSRAIYAVAKVVRDKTYTGTLFATNTIDVLWCGNFLHHETRHLRIVPSPAKCAFFYPRTGKESDAEKKLRRNTRLRLEYFSKLEKVEIWADGPEFLSLDVFYPHQDEDSDGEDSDEEADDVVQKVVEADAQVEVDNNQVALAALDISEFPPISDDRRVATTSRGSPDAAPLAGTHDVLQPHAANFQISDADQALIDAATARMNAMFPTPILTSSLPADEQTMERLLAQRHEMFIKDATKLLKGFIRQPSSDNNAELTKNLIVDIRLCYEASYSSFASYPEVAVGVIVRFQRNIGVVFQCIVRSRIESDRLPFMDLDRLSDFEVFTIDPQTGEMATEDFVFVFHDYEVPMEFAWVRFKCHEAVW